MSNIDNTWSSSYHKDIFLNLILFSWHSTIFSLHEHPIIFWDLFLINHYWKSDIKFWTNGRFLLIVSCHFPAVHDAPEAVRRLIIRWSIKGCKTRLSVTVHTGCSSTGAVSDYEKTEKDIQISIAPNNLHIWQSYSVSLKKIRDSAQTKLYVSTLWI